MISFLLFLGWWAMPTLLLSGFTSAYAVLIDRIAAVIDGEIITYSEIQIATIFKLSEGDDKEVLEALIDMKLLAREAEKFKITETKEDSEKIQRDFEEIKRLLTEEKFSGYLREYNLTESDILKRLREKIIAEKFIDFRINFFVVISDEAVRAYYADHREEFSGKTLEDDVYDEIKSRLFKIESDRRLHDYLNQIRKKAKIEVNL